MGDWIVAGFVKNLLQLTFEALVETSTSYIEVSWGYLMDYGEGVRECLKGIAGTGIVSFRELTFAWG